jgi:hypothetical protein
VYFIGLIHFLIHKKIKNESTHPCIWDSICGNMNPDENIEVYGFCGINAATRNWIAEILFLPMLQTKRTLIVSFSDYDEVSGTDYKYDTDHIYDTRTLRLAAWIDIHVLRGIERFVVLDVETREDVDMIKRYGGIIINIQIDGPGERNIIDVELQYDYEVIDDQYGPYNQIRDIIYEIQSKRNENSLTIFINLNDTICNFTHNYNIIIATLFKMLRVLIPTITHKEFTTELQTYSSKHTVDTKDALSEMLRCIFMNTIEKYGDAIHSHSHSHNYSNMSIGDSITRSSIQAANMGAHFYNIKFAPVCENIVNVLDSFASRGKVVIVASGPRIEQIRRIIEIGIQNFEFEAIPEFTPAVFKYMKIKYPSAYHVMIGSSAQCDSAVYGGFDRGIHSMVGDINSVELNNPAILREIDKLLNL